MMIANRKYAFIAMAFLAMTFLIRVVIMVHVSGHRMEGSTQSRKGIWLAVKPRASKTGKETNATSTNEARLELKLNSSTKYCLQHRNSPRDWDTVELTDEQMQQKDKNHTILWLGSCNNYCQRFCTNSTTYNSVHCTMDEYSNSICCPWQHNRLTSRTKFEPLQVGDACTLRNFCCPVGTMCLDQDAMSFVDLRVFNHKASTVTCQIRRCDSFCDLDEECCDDEWCDKGLGEVESGNGQCRKPKKVEMAF